MLASKEIRRQNQLHTKNRTVTARRLADFLNNASEHKTIRQWRIRDLEAKAIFEAIAGPEIHLREEALTLLGATSFSSTTPVKTLDFASLTAFEELSFVRYLFSQDIRLLTENDTISSIRSFSEDRLTPNARS